jgi:hypothetical protein
VRDDHLAIRKAAAVSGLSLRSIHELCLAGIVRARTVRGRWRVHRQEFVVWISGR